MRGKRGRPPKAQPADEEPSPAATRGLRPRRNLKPRLRDSGDEESPTREPTKPSRKKRVGPGGTSARGRGRGRGGGRGGRGGRGGKRTAAASKAVVYDDHESDEDEDDAVSLRSEEEEELVAAEPPSEEDEALKEESDCLEDDVLDEEEVVEEEEEVEDDASHCTESSFRSQSTHASTPGKYHRGVGGSGARTPAAGGRDALVVYLRCRKLEGYCSKWRMHSARTQAAVLLGGARAGAGVPGLQQQLAPRAKQHKSRF